MTMSLGLEVKSLIGMGIFLERYSQITSMLYLSWAEIGMIGAPSATVPEAGEERKRGGRERGGGGWEGVRGRESKGGRKHYA